MHRSSVSYAKHISAKVLKGPGAKGRFGGIRKAVGNNGCARCPGLTDEAGKSEGRGWGEPLTSSVSSLCTLAPESHAGCSARLL